MRRSGALAGALLAVLHGTAGAQDARRARQVHHVVESPALPRVRDTADARLRRAFVAHFEGYPAGVDRSCNYPRLEMARLGADEYLHQTWALKQFGLFEIPAIREFLTARGIAAGPSWVMDRYVRTVDPEQRHEVIFFYLESSAMHDPGMKFGGAPDPPPPPVPPPAVLEAVRARAAKAFQVSSEAE